MSLGKSEYLQELYQQWRFALALFASADAFKDVMSVAEHYIAIFKGDPEGAGVEVTGAGYARQPLGWGAANWTQAANIVTNDNDIDFGSAGSNWAPSGSEATHFAIFDALTVGNMLEAAELDVPTIIMNGDPVLFVAGQITFEED